MPRYEGVTVIEITLGKSGLEVRRNKNMVKLGAAFVLRNASHEDDTFRTGGGAEKLGVPVGDCGS